MASLTPFLVVIVGAIATASLVFAGWVYRQVREWKIEISEQVEKHERALYGSDEATDLAERVERLEDER